MRGENKTIASMHGMHQGAEYDRAVVYLSRACGRTPGAATGCAARYLHIIRGSNGLSGRAYHFSMIGTGTAGTLVVGNPVGASLGTADGALHIQVITRLISGLRVKAISPI